MDVAGPASAPLARRSRRADAWFYGLLALASVGLLYVSSLPGSPLILVVPALGLWLVVGVAWLVLLVLAIRRRRFSFSLVIGPAAVVIVGALSLSPWPLQARFDLARGSFDATVRTLPPDQSEGGSLGMVGSYPIKKWARGGDAVLFYASGGTGLVDDAGFVYSSHGVPEALTNSDDPGFEVMGWQDLGGGWYAWQASW